MSDGIQKARELMARSRRERFAVGAFSVDNQVGPEDHIELYRSAGKAQP